MKNTLPPLIIYLALLLIMPVIVHSQIFFPGLVDRDEPYRLKEEQFFNHAGTVWPITSTDICSENPDQGHCDPNKKFYHNLRLSLSNTNGFRYSRLGDSVDNLGSPTGKFLALGVRPEIGAQWNTLDPLISIDLGYRFSKNLAVYTQLNIERILDAWYDEKLGSNVPLNLDEININEPSLSYGVWQIENASAIVGRFPVHWSPSPYYGMTISNSVPYHDGAMVSFKSKHFRMHYLYSSLDPWLTGTPNEFNGTYPVGSEEYQQRNPGIDSSKQEYNSRNKVYTESQKNLFAHRAEFLFSPVTVGITEIHMVGGKSPEFRDANPFSALHNNFSFGYANVSVAMDFKVQWPKSVQFLGELFIDEIKEADDGGNPSSLGWMLGLLHNWNFSMGKLFQGLHFMKTDPFLYNHNRPYLKLNSRQVIKSNFISLDDSPFIDTYVIDYPLGYQRGPDVVDLWYDVAFAAVDNWKVKSKIGWLQKGEKTSFSSYSKEKASSPSGNPEREFQFHLGSTYQMKHWFFRLGYGLQLIESEYNIESDYEANHGFSVGAILSLK